MRRIATSVLVIFSLLIGSSAFADHRGNERHDRQDKKEQKMDKRAGKPGKEQGNKRPGNNMRPGNTNRPRNNVRPGNNMRPGNNGPGNHIRPGQPPHPRQHPHPVMTPPPPPPPHPYLNRMVMDATRGCRDVAVWQVDYDTYVVRYRKGNRFYTRYIYPELRRYGRPSLISVNWQPMAPWTLLPPIQVNINL